MADSGYIPLDPASDDLSPLPTIHRRGLIAITTLAALSFATSSVVLLYLSVKLVRWHLRIRKQARLAAEQPASPPVDLSLGLAQRLFVSNGAKPSTPPERRRPRPNQFLVLIYNLLLADIHQAASFILNGVWVGRDRIQVRTATCWVQAWLIQTGDVASSLFITAIAVHTYLALVRNYTPPQWALYTGIIGLWLFNYLLMVLGIAITDNGKEYGGFFVRATAWCWINVRYEGLRLYLHYLWIFLALAITGVLYTLIWLSLRNKSAAMSPSQFAAANESSTNINDPNDENAATSSIQKARPESATAPANSPEPMATANNHYQGGHHKAFLLYPLIYIVCTAPLALGRIATMAGVDVSVSYFVTAGALITSNGWLDVLLWGVTRHRLLFSSDVDTEDTGLNTFTFMRTPHGRRWGNMVWVEGGPAGKGGGGGGGGEGGAMGDEEGGGGGGAGGRRLGALGKRRVGWRQLKFRGSNAGLAAARQEAAERGRPTGDGQAADGPGHGGEEPGWSIQMNMVTTVVVEPAGAGDRMVRHTPSGSMGSAGLAYDGDSGSEDRLGKDLR